MTTRPDYARIQEEVKKFYRYVMLSDTWQPNEPFQMVEDTAYSLFGVFNVAIPVIYGKGDHAIDRLLEHILAGSDDVLRRTLFGSTTATGRTVASSSRSQFKPILQ